MARRRHPRRVDRARPDARLRRRGASFINYQTIVRHSELAQTAPQTLACSVIAYHTDNRSACAERNQIRKHVCGATKMHRFTSNVDHRNRRLGRNTRDVAPDKLIEHNVAQHDDVTIAKGMENFGSASFC